MPKGVVAGEDFYEGSMYLLKKNIEIILLSHVDLFTYISSINYLLLGKNLFLL